MLAKLKPYWQEFKRGRPGRRFEDRFERKKAARAERSWVTRFLKPAAGVLLLVAGVVFCLIPGPGIPLLVVGGGLLADVSRPAARAMDWVEVQVRKVASWGSRKWSHLSTPGRFAAAILAVCIAISVAYAAFAHFFG